MDPALPRHARLKWLPQRLGAQLSLAAALSLWLSITLFALYSIREQSTAAMATIEQQTRAMARDLALLSEPLLLADKLDDLEVLLRNTMEFEQILDVRVLDADGAGISQLSREFGRAPHAVYGMPGARQAIPVSAIASLTHDEQAQRVVAWRPIMSGTLLGWVRVDHGTQALAALRERIWLTSGLACLLACLVSVAMMRALLRRPLQALTAAQAFACDLQRIEGQQLTGVSGPQETRDLATALNQASLRLFEQRSTIEANIQRLQQQEARLASTNEQLRTIFALSPDALLSIDDKGLVNFANTAFFQLTGLHAQDVIGQPWRLLDAALQSQASDSQAAPPLAKLIESEQDDAQHWVLAQPRMTVLELRARAGRTASVSWLVYVRDITRESEIDRLKTEFLSTAAHELRTPMTGIFSCVELLMSREMPAQRQRDLLGIVNRQSRTLMTIVNDLLDLSRLEARGGGDFQLETLPLAGPICQAVADFVPPAGRNPVQVLQPDFNAMVRIDPGKLGQVVSNILSNAYKYSNDGAVQVRFLQTQHGSAEDEVGFEVEDQGIGMSAEQLTHVTERFYRADASGHVLGTGLGMSIVDNIVKLMGGRLALNSEPGRGTRVCVWLPRVHADQHPVVLEASSLEAA